WWNALRGLSTQPLSLGNYSLAPLLGSWIGIALTLGAVSVVWLGRRNRNDIAVLGLGCAATLLGSNLSCAHYFLLIAPFVMYFLPHPAAFAAAVLLAEPVRMTGMVGLVQLAGGAALVFALCARRIMTPARPAG